MTVPSAIHQRCFYHEGREAASRCPMCRRYFCRECVTEHDDRVLCVECLKTIVDGRVARQSGVRRVLRGLLPVMGILVAWLFFYTIGRALLLIPSAVHDGTVWEESK
jgi:hypothetical protein